MSPISTTSRAQGNCVFRSDLFQTVNNLICSLTVQMACLSGLVAFHLACQALSNGCCSAAIVAGTNLIITPTMMMAMTAEGVISSTGVSKIFDAKADGYGCGEAVTAILLKKINRAQSNNDRIQAKVRSTVTNFDGKTADMKTPNPQSHEQLIRTVYKLAGIRDPCETAFIECHGTGTTVGDPLEAGAIAKVFGDKGIIITLVYFSSTPFLIQPRLSQIPGKTEF